MSIFSDSGPARDRRDSLRFQAETSLQSCDQGGFSYPTPTDCDSPADGLQEITPASSVITPRKRESMEETTAVRKRYCQKPETMSPATESDGTVYLLLKTCAFGKKMRKGWNKQKRLEIQECTEEEVRLSDEHVREVLRAEAQLVCHNPCETIRSGLQNWVENESRKLHALGIPTRWRGIEAAAEYFIELRSNTIADPVSVRAAELLLFINYKDMCKRPADFCPRPRGKNERKSSYVLNCIIEGIPNYFGRHQSLESRRDNISNIVRYGGWWWKLSRELGIGLLLLGDDELFRIMKSDMFTNAQVNALITHVSRVRPGTIRLLPSINPIMRTLIRGEVPRGLVSALHLDGFPLFDQAKLSRANDEDDAALADQCLEAPWTNAVQESDIPGDILEILHDSETSEIT
ncbi:uncharacterized protein ACHE_10988S [Aspergillus chevalieri]|uniref:Uncharacterized protein n=1 Tax=Aspergillus chevalieri TaxID=182096 RepID=A0A7R7ZJS8_ASPCH|nr:uncharacterized protein ACHE_10988S [Aspergillus chevalieri]BCR83586.1 hypothetical protein ACHE_10988S [Aspergillus chevalieri]